MLAAVQSLYATGTLAMKIDGTAAQTCKLLLNSSSPIAAPRIAKSVMNVVTQNIRMQAALIHAVQPVHEVQDLRPPSPLPRGLCQFSKNHMWGGMGGRGF